MNTKIPPTDYTRIEDAHRVTCNPNARSPFEQEKSQFHTDNPKERVYDWENSVSQANEADLHYPPTESLQSRNGKLREFAHLALLSRQPQTTEPPPYIPLCPLSSPSGRHIPETSVNFSHSLANLPETHFIESRDGPSPPAYSAVSSHRPGLFTITQDRANLSALGPVNLADGDPERHDGGGGDRLQAQPTPVVSHGDRRPEPPLHQYTPQPQRSHPSPNVGPSAPYAPYWNQPGLPQPGLGPYDRPRSP